MNSSSASGPIMIQLSWSVSGCSQRHGLPPAAGAGPGAAESPASPRRNGSFKLTTAPAGPVRDTGHGPGAGTTQRPGLARAARPGQDGRWQLSETDRDSEDSARQ